MPDSYLWYVSIFFFNSARHFFFLSRVLISFQCSLKGSIKGGEENHDCGSSSTSDQDQMDGIDRQGEMIIDTGECRKRLLF